MCAQKTDHLLDRYNLEEFPNFLPRNYISTPAGWPSLSTPKKVDGFPLLHLAILSLMLQFRGAFEKPLFYILKCKQLAKLLLRVAYIRLVAQGFN
jgi:hypothetical protein